MRTQVAASQPQPLPDLSTGPTGPRTLEGKARSSRNALKHGLFSEDAVVRGESVAGFDSYRDDMLACHRPYDLAEHEEVEVMVMMKWKLRRLWRQEPRIYAACEAMNGGEDPHGAQAFFTDNEKKNHTFTRLTRQEAAWQRAYDRASDRLRLLQRLRENGLRTVGPCVEVAAETPVETPVTPADNKRNAEKTNRTPSVVPARAEAPKAPASMARVERAAPGQRPAKHLGAPLLADAAD